MSRVKAAVITLTSLSLIAICAWTISSLRRDVRYTITDLGSVRGDHHWRLRMNNLGHVVGMNDSRGGMLSGFFWTPEDGARRIGELGQGVVVADVNERDQVAGCFLVPEATTEFSQSSYPHGFIWSASEGITDLGTVGGKRSYATAISDAGEILGTAEIAGGTSLPFIWNATMGLKLFSKGDMVDRIHAVERRVHRVFPANFQPRDEANLYVWVGTNGEQVVGFLRYQESKLEAFYERVHTGTSLWMIGIRKILRLGHLFGAAPRKEPCALIWDSGECSALVDYIPSGSQWDSLTHADDINDIGQIVGIGTIKGNTHAFLLTPVEKE